MNPRQQAYFSAEDAYKRARATADVCARSGMDRARTQPDAPIPGSFLFHYAQLCEAEQTAYERMTAAQRAAR